MVEFLIDHKDRIEEHVSNIITNKHRSNKSHFFQSMASYVQTKSISQCKSRYQKKELEMLTAIGLPYNTIKSYFLFKKLKNPFNKARRIYNDDNKGVIGEVEETKPQTPDPNAIYNGGDLRRVIMGEIMPRVVNPMIRGDIQVFVDHLSSRENLDRFVPLVNVNSIHKVLNQHGIFQLKGGRFD